MADEFVLKRSYEKIHILKNLRKENNEIKKPMMKDLNISWQIQSILNIEEEKEQREEKQSLNVEQ